MWSTSDDKNIAIYSVPLFHKLAILLMISNHFQHHVAAKNDRMQYLIILLSLLLRPSSVDPSYHTHSEIERKRCPFQITIIHQIKLNIFPDCTIEKRSHSIRNWSIRLLCAHISLQFNRLCFFVVVAFYCRWEYWQLSWEIQIATKDYLHRFSSNFHNTTHIFSLYLSLVRSFALHLQ